MTVKGTLGDTLAVTSRVWTDDVMCLDRSCPVFGRVTRQFAFQLTCYLPVTPRAGSAAVAVEVGGRGKGGGGGQGEAGEWGIPLTSAGVERKRCWLVRSLVAEYSSYTFSLLFPDVFTCRRECRK